MNIKTNNIFRILSSIYLTVWLLGLSVVLILFGTLDQVHLGVFRAQEKYFESFVAIWQYPAQWIFGDILRFIHIPLPGGYLLGPLLIVNLVCSHFRYFRPSWRKAGIPIIHFGVVMLLFSQLYTQLVQVESQMSVREGESKNYAEVFRTDELVLIDKSGGETDRVVSIPISKIKRGGEISHDALPFSLEVHAFFQNANIFDNRSGGGRAGDIPVPITAGLGQNNRFTVEDTKPVSKDDEINRTTAVVTLEGSDGDIGTFLVSNVFSRFQPQEFTHDGKRWQIELRFKRKYLPYTITLLDFRHDKYPGTEIPFNFSSHIRLQNPETGEDRETNIYMNNPLRYAGLTFYQASFAEQDTVSIFQVVRNPGWTFPYIACLLMTAGMVIQFGIGLGRFVIKKPSKGSGNAQTKPTPESSIADTDDSGDLPAAARERDVPSVRRWQAAFPTVAGLVGCLVLFTGFTQPETASAYDADRFGAIPVQESGRVKPLDSVAREALLIIGGKQTWEDEQGNRRPAIEWLMRLTLHPETANNLKVFRIDNRDVTGQLDAADPDQKMFSWNEIQPHIPIIRQIAQEAPEEAQKRTPAEKGFVKLTNGLSIYYQLMHSFSVPQLVTTLEDEFTSFQRLVRPGLMALTQREAGRAFDEQALERFLLFVRDYRQIAEVAYFHPIPPHELPEDQLPALLDERAIIGASVGPESVAERGRDWLAVGETLARDTIREGDLNPVALHYARIVDAYRAGNPGVFNEAVEALHATLDEQVDKDQLESAAFEKTFNDFDPFLRSMILYVLGFLAAGASWLKGSRTLVWTALILVGVGLLAHTWGLGARTIIQDRPPITNLYSSAVFTGWFCAVMAVFIEAIFRNGFGSAAGAVVGFVTLIIAAHLGKGGDTMEMMRAVLDSNFWLATHVPTVTIGYSATFLAGALAVFYLIFGFFTGGLKEQTANELIRMAYGITCFALLFSFVGTILGGVWADQSWGRFWGWDPKENGAVMIVLWNAIVLHARWARLVGRVGLMVLIVFGSIITAWSWFGTNLLGIGLHSYGFTDSGFMWMLIFWISMAVIMALGLIPKQIWGSSAAHGRL